MLSISRNAGVLAAVLIGVITTAAAAEKEPVKQPDRIRVYNTKKTGTFDLPSAKSAKGRWEDISPAKYDVWHQPCKDLSLWRRDHHAFIVEAFVKDPSLPPPAAGLRGLTVVFPGRFDGPAIYINTSETNGSDKPIIRQVSCGEVVLRMPLGPYMRLDRTIKPDWRKRLAGTFSKEFKYKLTRTAAGQDKLIVHHVTGVGWDPNDRQTVIWEIGLGDWFATIKFPKETDIECASYLCHARLISIPGKGEKGKDIVLDAKVDGEEGYRQQTSIDTATQRRYAFIQRPLYNTLREKPGAGFLPFVWWEKTGTGKVWTFNGGGWEGHYQYMGRADAKSAGMIRFGGIPISEKDLLRTDTMISKTLPPGRYRRMVLVGKNWKFDQIVEVTEKNQGKDLPAKVAGSEYLYLIDDLEERIFPGKKK